MRVIRPGVGAPGFEPFEALPSLTGRVTEYIGKHAAEAKSGKPFFLMYTLPAPHSPVVPTTEWQGKSGLGNYADWVMQTDAAIGAVMDALDRGGLAGNTLLIVTSDNGCAPYNGVTDKLGEDVRGNMRNYTAIGELEAAGHFASAQYRGYKADIWEGGHRVPYFVRWPGKVKAGSGCAELICLTDLMATCADILALRVPPNAGEDSVSIAPALFGKARAPLREAVVHHSIQGKFALRQGEWKLVFGPGSGGWSQPGDKQARQQGLPSVQLYDMAADPAEARNLQAAHPELVRGMIHLLELYVAEGRSTPGAAQQNDVPVDIWKRTPATP